jgi:copper chaperone
MQTMDIAIDGMTCQGCVGSVTRVLKAVPGVTDVSATLTPPRAHVTFDPARTGVAAFGAALEDAGYAIAG